MDSQLGKTNLKREHDEDDNDQNQRQKTEVPERTAATTIFTDVNDDCLVHIFKHLLLPDLINVADTCKRFQASTQSTFVEKCRGKKIKFNPSSSNRIQPIKLFGNTVEIYDLMSCLKVLRHFGVKIPRLNIDYGKLRNDKIVALAWYMNKYCADSLVDVKVKSAKNEVTTNWTKPFSHAESVELRWCDLGNLSAWFPNVHRLVLFCPKQCIKYTFPHLEDLEISRYNYYMDARESVMEMLRLNPHLQKLDLSFCGFDMKFTEAVSEFLLSVRVLGIYCDEKCFNLEEGSIHLKNLNEFHIDLLSFDSLPKIPFKFDQLEKVKLTVKQFNLNDNFEKFIRENASLKKLIVCASAGTLDSTSMEQIKSNLAEISPSLTVEFEGHFYRVIVIEEPKKSIDF